MIAQATLCLHLFHFCLFLNEITLWQIFHGVLIMTNITCGNGSSNSCMLRSEFIFKNRPLPIGACIDSSIILTTSLIYVYQYNTGTNMPAVTPVSLLMLVAAGTSIGVSTPCRGSLFVLRKNCLRFISVLLNLVHKRWRAEVNCGHKMKT